MSATKAGRELASPDSRRHTRATRSKPPRMPRFNSDPGSAPGSPAGGTHRVPDPQPARMHQPGPHPENSTETWWESVARAQRAREGRLRSLWQMTPAQRVAAMRRGELTYEQLAAWSARHPDEVPVVHGEFEWILAKLPEVCE
ncbi:MAG: hypothetical protein WAN22_34640 [Solirubrobacteraceae bacterium]